MSAVAIANLAVASVNALAAAIAAVGIWYGIRAMVRASDERGQQHRAATQQQSAAMQQQREAEERRHGAMLQALQQQREADERRHEESMTALKALIAGRRTAVPETVAERTTPTDDGAGTKGA